MPLKNDEERRVRQYFLGELTGEDLEAIEKRFIQNDGYFDDVQALEDRLIADYLAGHLSDLEMPLFETNFLVSPRRKRKVETQRGIQDFLLQARRASAEADSGPARVADRLPAFVSVPPGRKFAWLAAAAALALSLGLGYYAVAQHGEITDLRDQLAREGSPVPVRETASQTVAMVLNPGIERSGPSPNAALTSPRSGLIQLRLLLPASRPHTSYTAGVELPDGTLLLKRYLLRPESSDSGMAFVDLIVPSSLVPPGDYVATLTGVAASGNLDPQPSYVFRVR